MTDIIQLLILIVLAGSLIVLIYQTKIQNQLLRGQLLKDRFEMYFKTYEPVTDSQVAEFKLYPEGYMDRKRFEEHYSENEDGIRKYIYMSWIYEYLAFTFTLRTMKVPDPLGPHWVELWIKELVSVKEFQHVHEEYQGFYPQFESFVDSMIKKVTN